MDGLRNKQQTTREMDDSPQLRQRRLFCAASSETRERERQDQRDKIKSHWRSNTPGGICDCEMHRSTALSTARRAALRSYSRDASFISCQGHKASVHSCLAQEPPQRRNKSLPMGYDEKLCFMYGSSSKLLKLTRRTHENLVDNLLLVLS